MLYIYANNTLYKGYGIKIHEGLVSKILFHQRCKSHVCVMILHITVPPFTSQALL